jgi:hypothetical protein
VSLGSRSVSGRNIEDPRFRSIAPLPVQISGTAFAATYLAGSARGPAPSPAGPQATLDVRLAVGGVAAGARRVPLWRVSADWDDPAGPNYAARALSSVVCTAYLFRGRWALLAAEPRYDADPFYTGRSAADAREAFPASVLVEVEVHDAGEPPGPRLPTWITFWRILVGLVLIVAAVFMSCCSCCFCYIVRRNSRENMGLPPPFFASWRQFRGW